MRKAEAAAVYDGGRKGEIVIYVLVPFFVTLVAIRNPLEDAIKRKFDDHSLASVLGTTFDTALGAFATSLILAMINR